MASVKLVLRQQQTDKAGHSPLYLRVIKDRKTKFITTGVKLLPTEWDEAKQKIKKNHPNSARMNAFLAQQIADADKFDLILQEAVFVSPRIDITDKVLKSLSDK